ncbi:hypothetical protein [Allobranchiibius sp. CTAmp26]|uniref:hypothetical protein n=1 Tax=Allobranchiibius sp. CTAmp26 TaxID=2815214 RepID=UPI001AA0DFD6|nr:hypothetical protein [Allobranchiibius sp. CTAmp26]MBO1753957.1 hypothetical protein [Allobranchiibius sp. CTAmp26]
MSAPTRSATPDSVTHHRVFAALVGVVAVIVLFQGVWAGIFIREAKENNSTWVQVHARGADLAILLAIIAVVWAVLRLRARKDLLFGSIALAVILVVEAYIGGIIGDSPGAQAVHFPLAMALMGLCVWLPFRASQR